MFTYRVINNRLQNQGVYVVCFCRLLRQCKHLKLVDVSFCSQLTVEIVEGLQEMYPAVSIKKSFIVEEFAS